MSKYILPIFLILIFVYAIFKKINLYDSFASGIKQSLSLVAGIFPYICAIMIAIGLFRASGLATFVANVVSPVFSFLGIPKQLCELVILRPFTGSGSLSLLSDIFSTYGVDSYISRCASCIMGSSETVFYVCSVYFAGIKTKGIFTAIAIGLVCSLLSAVLSCLFCKIM